MNKYSIRDVMENKMRLLVGADSHVGFVIPLTAVKDFLIVFLLSFELEKEWSL